MVPLEPLPINRLHRRLEFRSPWKQEVRGRLESSHREEEFRFGEEIDRRSEEFWKFAVLYETVLTGLTIF